LIATASDFKAYTRWELWALKVFTRMYTEKKKLGRKDAMINKRYVMAYLFQHFDVYDTKGNREKIVKVMEVAAGRVYRTLAGKEPNS